MIKFFLITGKKLIPESYSLVVYRHYEEVVASIYKRRYNEKIFDKRFLKLKISVKRSFFQRAFAIIRCRLFKAHSYNLFLTEWIKFNKALLKFINEEKSEKLIVIGVDDVIQHSDTILNVLIERWGFDLIRVPIDEVFSPGSLTRMKKGFPDYRESIKKRADEIYKKLEAVNNVKAPRSVVQG